MELEEAVKVLKSSIADAEEKAKTSQDGIWKERYYWIVDMIESQCEEAEHLYNNMKEEGLTFDSIEAEGFLRCAKILNNQLHTVDRDI